MDIETLKIFCDLAELRNFSKAAEKHDLSQSSVSQKLAQLELTHKCQLVDRKKRPLELTRQGRLLYEAVKDMLERYEQLKSELSTLKSSIANRINVAAIFSIGMHSLPEYVKRFMIKYPEVNVHIEYLGAGKIYEIVSSGEVDIGLVAIPKRDKRLDIYDFENEPLVLVCSPKNTLAGQSKVDINKVQFERFIGFDRDIPTRIWIDNILQRYNITVQPTMEFDNIETVKRAVEINAGVSILPQPAVVQEVSAGTLRAIEFSNENFVRPTGIIVRRDKVLTQAGKYFIRLLCGKE